MVTLRSDLSFFNIPKFFSLFVYSRNLLVQVELKKELKFAEPYFVSTPLTILAEKDIEPAIQKAQADVDRKLDRWVSTSFDTYCCS